MISPADIKFIQRDGMWDAVEVIGILTVDYHQLVTREVGPLGIDEAKKFLAYKIRQAIYGDLIEDLHDLHKLCLHSCDMAYASQIDKAFQELETKLNF